MAQSIQAFVLVSLQEMSSLNSKLHHHWAQMARCWPDGLAEIDGNLLADYQEHWFAFQALLETIDGIKNNMLAICEWKSCTLSELILQCALSQF